MEAFLYQQQRQPSFLLDPASYISGSHNTGISLLPLHHQVQAAGEMSNVSSSCFTSYNSSEASMQEDSISSLDAAVPPAMPQLSSEKKRKQSAQSCLSPAHQKGLKESKSRRKKANEKTEEKKKSNKAKELKAAKAPNEEPPSGYIHVRARRGQATDSHSLAERVRRERISERMKKLQGLVPGCDKVIGKALVLDEIINYVQSLQNQIEFLSMKLASVNPILYDFGGGYEEYMSQAEEIGSISQSIPSVIQNSHIQPTAFEAAANSGLQQVIDPAGPFPLHGQGPRNFNHQGSGSFLMQVELSNMCTFQ